ncbi:MAG: hypothetical protein D6718_11080 [Acidobacteria bacterium]|nr:MAG: hypothetical protein D6718_11080 [Acidobacteriota bacterium]
MAAAVQDRARAAFLPVDRQLGRRARASVEAIAETLAGDEEDAHDPTLATGTAGVALFLAYAGRSFGSERWSRAAALRLSAALAAAPRRCSSAALFGGLLGPVWVAAHLAREGLLPLAFERAVRPADALIGGLCRRAGDTAPVELMYGLAGYGVAALERGGNREAGRALEEAVRRIVRRAERDGSGVRWATPFGDYEYNLGLAHGVPGVAAFLARAAAAGPGDDEELRSVISGALRWTWRMQRRGGALRFPAMTGRAAGRPARSRLGWCYGDLGVASAMAMASRVTGDRRWCARARALALRAGFLPPKLAGVADASLCHGAAGVAHLCGRLGRALRVPALLRAARRWLRRAVDFHRPDVGGIAGLEPVPGPAPGRAPTPGERRCFLIGAAGVGLVLLEALGPEPPAWDRVLLLSAPEVGGWR